MRISIFLVSFVAIGLAQPPATKVNPVTETLHGVSLTDPYRWLEDQNSPETRAWIKAQASYTQTALNKVPQRSAIQRQDPAGLRLTCEKIVAPATGRP